MEVTYIDEKKSVESARKWGHIHFQEIIERVPWIKSKNIVFIHLSARYSHQHFRSLIEQHLPEDSDRIHLL
jgi:ribonuclease Z